MAILATLLYRKAENNRKRSDADMPIFIKYSSPFIAMQMGRKLLRDLNISNYKELNHTVFKVAYTLVQQNGNIYFEEAVCDIKNALEIYYNRDINSIPVGVFPSIFRRGDLLEHLK